MLVYVDDVIAIENSIFEVESVIQQLKKVFAMKDLEDLSYFLGIEVKYTPIGLHLSQQKYVTNLLKKIMMHEASSLPSSMTCTIVISKFFGTLFDNPQLY